jgi:hypothetical protein
MLFQMICFDIHSCQEYKQTKSLSEQLIWFFNPLASKPGGLSWNTKRPRSSKESGVLYCYGGIAVTDKIERYYDVLRIKAEATDQEVSDSYHDTLKSWKPHWAYPDLNEMEEAFEKIMAHQHQTRRNDPIEGRRC